ncbi:hypothetical protein D8674_021205 [Pyrus ussuriensis x Pyrus communis]|uniref:Uncharacterized protein n=1 Tax=Pyrus ussuriensis x Pyrus communis TaxID=2448454 RepID=A0A5N5GHP6_9ROSA|nr:hypothetical protein D8674_021205 [Pyrus ussuriensis x Pyrus communis]
MLKNELHRSSDDWKYVPKPPYLTNVLYMPYPKRYETPNLYFQHEERVTITQLNNEDKDEEAVVEICISNITADYMVYLENISISQFSRLLEVVKNTNLTNKKESHHALVVDDRSGYNPQKMKEKNSDRETYPILVCSDEECQVLSLPLVLTLYNLPDMEANAYECYLSPRQGPTTALSSRITTSSSSLTKTWKWFSLTTKCHCTWKDKSMTIPLPLWEEVLDLNDQEFLATVKKGKHIQPETNVLAYTPPQCSKVVLSRPGLRVGGPNHIEWECLNYVDTAHKANEVPKEVKDMPAHVAEDESMQKIMHTPKCMHDESIAVAEKLEEVNLSDDPSMQNLISISVYLTIEKRTN